MVVQHISQRLSNPNPSVFISYSHKDKPYLDRLRVHLRPQEREGAITFWDDSQIKPGDHWKREIERALESAQVAILLVSADFLASDFVTEEEVRKLLAAERRGVRILPVILTPCGFPSSHLSSFQTVNEPSKPLSGMNSHDQDVVWQRVVENVMEKLNPHPPVLYSTYPILTAPSSSGGQEVKGKTFIFKEHRDAIEAAIDMLEALPPLHHELVAPIKISVQGTTIFKSLGPEMYQRWSRARVEALKNGWSMRAYWRLNDDGLRMERWVKDTLDVLQAGVYEPYYFLDRPNQKGLLSTPYDLLLIPKSHNRPAQAMLF
ncbi:MAG TPA: toll/interleukin-1 receptor domain-containing protein, partial [Ktedonobacterales bacterium]